MKHIDWEPPPPRAGRTGTWDRFVGPGATGAEEWLQLAGVLLLISHLLTEAPFTPQQPS